MATSVNQVIFDTKSYLPLQWQVITWIGTKNTFDSIVMIINLLEGTTLLLSDVLEYSNGSGNGLLHVWKWKFIWKYVHDYLAICKKKANMLLL